MSITKPATSHLFDTNNTNTADPGAGIRLDGYLFEGELPSNEYNFWQRHQGLWLDYLIRNSAWDTLAEGIQNTEPGDVFRVSGDDPAGVGIIEGQVANTAFGALHFLDTDGDYFAWICPEDLNVIRLRRFSDASEVLITIPAAELADNVWMDGENIYVLTTANNLRVCDYTGSWSAVVAQTGTILDVGRGHVLIAESATTWRLRDSALTSIGTQNIGAVTIEAGRIANTGAVADVLILYTAAGPTNYLRLASEAGVTTWTYTLSAAGTSGLGMWLDGPFAEIVLFDGANDLLVTVPIGDATPQGERSVTMSNNYDYYVASPHFLFGYATSGTLIAYIDWAGVELGQLDTLGADPITGQAQCDGFDLIYPQYDAGGPWNNVVRHPIGNRGAALRRYDTDDWRPLCRSLAIACERIGNS